MKGKGYWRVVYLAIPLTVAVFAAILLANAWKAARPDHGVGRMPEVARYADGVEAETEEAAEYRMESYTEGVGPAPEWWDPDEPMAVEWHADLQQTCNKLATNLQSDYNAIQRTDAGCPDWNVDSTLCGWDGHGMEAWEFGVFSRIFYLEFWQPNLTLCEAGCDAILRMWEMNGGTMYETLSHVNEDGSYAYSTFPGMWDETYDQDGLNWCTDFCMERFVNGPVWQAQYFRKGQYHDWGEWSPIPAYEICGIFFSVAK